MNSQCTVRRGLASLIGLSIGLASLAAIAQDQSWILQFGTNADDIAMALASDGAGGVFIGGETQGSLGGESTGSSDAWLARYDASGNQLWIVQFGTDSPDGVTALAPDQVGGVYVAGVTEGSLGHDNFGSVDPWLARYDSSGNRLWLRQFGTDRWDESEALAADGTGGVFIGGITDGDLGGENLGQGDAWIARYTSSGQRTWLVQFGTEEGESVRGIVSDGNGGAFLTGYTSGNLGGPQMGGGDVWLGQITSAGNLLWTEQFGSTLIDTVDDMISDAAGGVFIGGDTEGNLDGPNAGGRDSWVGRFDDTGNVLWIEQFGTEEEDGSNWSSGAQVALAPDGADGVIVGGNTNGDLGGENTGQFDIWLTQFTAAGQRPWLIQFGSLAPEASTALLSDEAGGVYFAGFTEVGDLGGPPQGLDDIWLAHYTIGELGNLTGFSMTRGDIIAGNDRKLRTSNTKYLKLGSEFIPGGNPPQEVRLEVRLKFNEENPESLLLSLESRLTENGGRAKIYVRDWTTGEWVRVHTYPIGRTETVEAVADLDPDRFIKESGLIKLRIHYEHVTDEFNALIDHVKAVVR